MNFAKYTQSYQELQKEWQLSMIKYVLRLNKVNTQQNKEANSSKFTVSK